VATGVSKTGVTSTVAVAGGVVYFGDWGGMIHAVHATDGTRVWSTQVASANGHTLWNPRNQIGSQQNTVIWSSPNVVEGRLLIGVGSFQVFTGTDPFTFKGNVVGVDAQTGMVDWTTYVTD